MNIDHLQYLDVIRRIVFSFPKVEEYTCFGTPAFRVNKKLLARIKEDGETVAVHCEKREKWMELDSVVFFITYHYRNSATVLVNLKKVNLADLKQLLQDAWQEIAPKKLLKGFDFGVAK